MPRHLRVLLIEGSEADALVVLQELGRAYDVAHERVQTPEALGEALDRAAWDLVVSDYSLSTLDAARALAIVRERQLDLPFIIVSDTTDEDTAVAAMQAGAHDFFGKGKLARLLPAVERALAEAAGRAERKRMKEQLLVSDRMASLGTLAAGVAHEINNPLAAILANVDVVLMDLADAVADYDDAKKAGRADPAARLSERVAWCMQALRESREAALRVCDVSRDLKVFSRGDDARRTAVDVRRVLDSSLRIAHNEIRHRANVVRQYHDVPAVEANETRLGQVFLNLLVNAAQAIPEGSASQNEIRVIAKREGSNRVVVEIHDTGAGIPPDVLPHIFDPFYTTKAVGIGTGLGLAICHRVVTELGGEIAVDSTRSMGTTFSVHLPVAAGSVQVNEPSATSTLGMTRRAKVLVIDDDELVLNATTRILRSHHEVVGMTSAIEALEHVARGTWFDVILCDVLMPNMTGIAFYEELRRRAPEQAERVAFMTGGAFTSTAREFLDAVRQPLLDKPFDAAQLLVLVDSVLRSPA